MHQLTSGFILLLLFTLSTVSSLPTLNPEAKDIVRENSLIQGAIPKFVSKGVVHGGEGGEESTEIQVKNDKEEQEEEGDDASTMIGSIVANRNHDEIKPEKKSWESPDRGKEEKTDGENNGEVNVEDEVEVIIESQDDEDKSQLEAIVDVDIGNDNSEQGRNEVEVDIENNNEESRGEGSSEVKVEARTDKHSGDGDGEGKAEAGAIVEETEERCDGRHDGKDEFSAEYHPETKQKQNHQEDDCEQGEARYDFKLESEFEEEDVFSHNLHPEFNCHSASIRPNHHQSNCYYCNYGSHPRAQVLQEPEKPEDQWLEQGRVGATARPQSIENTLGKRSAEPKRLPAHHVMEKHLKLAETSPHLLGVEDVEQLKDIWEKNLPYPIDGSPMRVGGPIRKRAAGRESRVVEQRQKKDELRQACGKPINAAAQRPDDNERDIGLQEIKDEKKSLSELSNLGYRLDLGKTDEQIAIGQEQELQQQIMQQQQRVASCSCDVCRDNAERKREKEQMRHGDAGLLAQLFPSQKLE